MKLDLGKSDFQKESLTTTFFKIFIWGWLIYFFVSLFVEHFYPGISMDFMLHDSYGDGTNDWFRDFFEVNRAGAVGNSYQEDGKLAGSCGNYPPLVLVIGKFFALFTPDIMNTQTYPELYWATNSFGARTVYFLFAAVMIFLFAYAIYSHIRQNHCELEKDPRLPLSITVTMLFSYSVIFNIERGNYIYIAIVAFAFFVFFYGKNDTVSSISLAICACIKIYPVIFFVLFLINKKYKTFLIGVAIGIVGLFVPMLFLNGPYFEKLLIFFKGVLFFNNNSQAHGNVVPPFYMIEQHSNSFSNIFRAIALAIAQMCSFRGIDAFCVVMSTISSVMNVILLLTAIIALVFNKSFWKRACILLCVVTLIPNNTFDYMLAFFLPLLAMVLCKGETKDRKYVIAMTVLACVPKGYCYFNYRLDTSLQTLINPIIMTGIIILFVLDSIPEIKKLNFFTKQKHNKKENHPA